jgi:hypothetical protein
VLYRVETDHQMLGMPESLFYVVADSLAEAEQIVTSYAAQKFSFPGRVLGITVLSDGVLMRNRAVKDLGVAEEVPSENGE